MDRPIQLGTGQGFSWIVCDVIRSAVSDLKKPYLGDVKLSVRYRCTDTMGRYGDYYKEGHVLDPQDRRGRRNLWMWMRIARANAVKK